MISVKLLAKQAEKFAVDNAPAILTGVGAVGAVVSVFFTGKATFKASTMMYEDIDRRAMMNEPDQTTKDVVKLVWKEYLPPASALTISVAAIVCANRVSSKRAAAMAVAYSLSEKAYGEYREKVVEKFNANKERQLRDEIAQDHVTKDPPKDAQIIITGNGDVLCHDLPTGRYFKSNMEKLRSVMNDVNAEVNQIGHSPLTFFYQSLNLKSVPYSDEIGWTSEKLLDIHFSGVLTDDNQPCIAINYECVPLRKGAGFPRGCDDEPPF